GQRWTKIRMLRVDPADDGWPLGCTDVYLEPDVAEAVGDQVLDPKRLISDMVEQATGRTVHTIEQRVRAATVPDAMVDLLRTAPGSPVLRVTRRYLDRGGQPFEITVSVHPADRFEYAVDLKRGRGGRSRREPGRTASRLNCLDRSNKSLVARNAFRYRGCGSLHRRNTLGTNTEFELQGLCQLALVCEDMERTVDFYTNVLGMKLSKTIQLPNGGQHF